MTDVHNYFYTHINAAVTDSYGHQYSYTLSTCSVYDLPVEHSPSEFYASFYTEPFVIILDKLYAAEMSVTCLSPPHQPSAHSRID